MFWKKHNDGCPDSVEGDAEITLSNLNPDTRISGPVDSNGVPVAVGSTGQGIGSSQDPTVNACASCPTDMFLSQGKTLKGIEVDGDTLTYINIGDATNYYNGMGFNPKDGFIYAIESTSGSNKNSLMRINPNTGASTLIGVVTDLPALGSGRLYAAGEIDPDGNFYVMASSGSGADVIYKIDISPKRPPQLHSVKKSGPLISPIM